MSPWLLYFPPITMYGTCIVIGLLFSWLLARRLAARTCLHPSHIDLLIPLLTAAGLLGAYAFGQLTDLFTHDPANSTVLAGSLLLCTLAGIAYALLAKIPLGLLGDITAAPIALAIAIGRIGCFFAGCCYGKPTSLPFAIHFPARSFVWFDQLRQGLIPQSAPHSLSVHPVQLYEAALCLLLAVLLTVNFTQRKISGECFLLLGIFYPLIRFPLEFLRADNPPIFLTLTFSQLFSLIIFLIALATLLLRRKYASLLHLLLAQKEIGPA